MLFAVAVVSISAASSVKMLFAISRAKLPESEVRESLRVIIRVIQLLFIFPKEYCRRICGDVEDLETKVRERKPNLIFVVLFLTSLNLFL